MELKKGREVCEYGDELHLRYLSLRFLWDPRVEMKVAHIVLMVRRVMWGFSYSHIWRSLEAIAQGPCEKWEEKKSQTRIPESANVYETDWGQGEEIKMSDTVFLFFPLLIGLPGLVLTKVEWSQGDLWALKIFIVALPEIGREPDKQRDSLDVGWKKMIEWLN